ncbi:hypothetical protein NLG97_g33 [Lecanicillium saksenae]|uniref:Uncharacterized protein n=1 Tax=Lecanicillium saksenae TaxID=468837 RepID=A0ACC1R7S2_9HYPO|nr:hypothetical protein NLG97_g33 [Lecanicillium saksenae]
MWGCSTDILLPFFIANFSRDHLDCGVATGYFPAKSLSQPYRKGTKQELALLDLTSAPLLSAQKRIEDSGADVTVSIVEADVTLPFPTSLHGKKFLSISMFNLFHCIPGGKSKFAGFANARQILADDGVLYGCTILGQSETRSAISRLYMSWYNYRWKVFHNWDDRREDVEAALHEQFEQVETCVQGSMLLFRATCPRRF